MIAEPESHRIASEAITAALRGDLETLYRLTRSLKDEERWALSVAAERLMHACE